VVDGALDLIFFLIAKVITKLLFCYLVFPKGLYANILSYNFTTVLRQCFVRSTFCFLAADKTIFQYSDEEPFVSSFS
jgi:hypothetical protein